MNSTRSDRGFGLLELVIAMLLLGLIAVAILPVLWNGIAFSARQADTATATRYLNGIVDDARDSARTAKDPTAWCAAVKSAAPAGVPTDPNGKRLFSVPIDSTSCTSETSSTMRINLSATVTTASGAITTLANVTALVFLP